ncbi:hypothetical protein, conserved [Eimeria praecox]|uniref:Uncharacterized protein n=1 Tax=Eimeria praecox TaxID=51316 RepID=U6G2J2_9EIME|nr:hypothetical protein, conserved [Eimeria praecox]
MYRGAVGGTPKTPPWMLVEGRDDAGVGGSPETEAMPKGEDDQSSQGNELSGAGNDGSPQSSGSWRDEPIEEGYWENREVPLDTAVQMERTLENVVHHATVCWEILPYIPSRKLQRFTVTVVKTLCIQLGVHSLTPPRLEYYRDKAGQRLVTLITRALELGETYFTPRQQRELTDLLGFTRVIMTPRPPGEDLTPRKFRSKILGIMSFSAVVHWYLTGIILGMKYHLATYRELTEAFVESQTNLIAIVHDHQLARVVLDTGSRWYIERTQMVLSLTTFFNREQARHSSSVPVPSINDFASSLGRAISRAGGLMYESIHGVKHVSTGNKASVLVGRSGPNVVYSSSTEPSGVVGALPVLPGVGQPGTDGTLAARPASPKETRTQSISPFQDKHSRRVAYTSPERGHSPGTKHPSEHLPQLQTTSELAGAPEPQQPQQAVPPTLQAPLKAEYPPSPRESEVDPRTTRTTPVARYPSSAGGVPGMYGGSPTQQGAGLQQAFGESVDKPLSVPSELLRKALEVETSLQQSPDVDESSAVSRYGHRRGDAAVPAESPGLPLTRQPQQISDGWGHFPFSDRRWLPAQPPQIPAHLSEQKTETSTGYAPPRPPPGFESLFDVGKRLDLLPKTRESRSPSPQPFFPGLPETGAEHSLSFTTRFAFDSWVAPLGSSFHTSSSQRGESASHSSLSPANSLRGSLLTSSTPTPSGIDLSGLVRGSGTLPSSLRPAESVGSPYGQPHSGMPPAFEHGPSGVTGDADEPVQESLAVGISNYEEPQDGS